MKLNMFKLLTKRRAIDANDGFVVLSKEFGTPLCLRQADPGQADPIVYWLSESGARSYVASLGGGTDSWEIVRVSDFGLESLAESLGIKPEEVRFISK